MRHPSIRRTAKRLALHSEASHRFERGVDPDGTIRALDRVVDLLASAARGIPVPGVADRYPGRPKPSTLFLREERVEEILGVRIGAQQVEKLLRSLGLKTQRQASSGRIKVVVPPRRRDLTREADLIEELARLHGYQRVPSTLPLLRSSGEEATIIWAGSGKRVHFSPAKGWSKSSTCRSPRRNSTGCLPGSGPEMLLQWQF